MSYMLTGLRTPSAVVWACAEARQGCLTDSASRRQCPVRLWQAGAVSVSCALRSATLSCCGVGVCVGGRARNRVGHFENLVCTLALVGTMALSRLMRTVEGLGAVH